MLLAEELTLPCGLSLRNRLAKAAMAESMAPTHIPNEKFPRVYGEWADGGWGLVMTGNVQVSETYLGGPGDVAVPFKASANPSHAEQELWKNWAATCQRSGTPAIVQINHPGRQSPAGSGNRGFFDKTLAPSAVKLSFGRGLIAKTAVWFVFGTPRALTVDEIFGEGGVIDQFVAAAKQSFDAGFKGVELHAAHGYLLAQFMSPQTNLRNDEFGGSAAKRVEVVLRIIRRIRQATSKEFCIGIKLNSVDASSSESPADTIEQIKLIAECGIDFVEISGGTYESPRMVGPDWNASKPIAEKTTTTNKSTVQRESFFLEFAKEVREKFPSVVLMVTGGFRTRRGMEDALQSGACDLIGIARPAAVLPKLPKEIILNAKIPDAEATVALARVKNPLWMEFFPLKQVGAGYQTVFYAGQIQRMGEGLRPIYTKA